MLISKVNMPTGNWVPRINSTGDLVRENVDWSSHGGTKVVQGHSITL